MRRSPVRNPRPVRQRPPAPPFNDQPRTHAQQIADAIRWLGLHARPAKNVRDSYALAQLVRRDAGFYVNSQAVASAARRLGYAVGEPDKFGNCWIGLRVVP